MNSDVKKALAGVGLNMNEIKIYVASLKLGKTNISQLSQHAKIKRPTAYAAVSSLLNKEMIIIDKTNKERPLYKANDPQLILKNLKQREKAFANIFPELRKISINELAPHVEVIMDSKDVKKLYTDLLKYAQKKEVTIYGTIDSAGDAKLHDDLLKYWMKSLKSNKVKIKEILPYTDENLNYIRQVEKIGNSRHKIRVIPETFQYLPFRTKILDGDNFIYNNKVISFSAYKNGFYAIAIHHKKLYQMYKDLFDMAWEMAEEG